MDLGLTNKVVVISGASRGLGFATAKVFAEEGANLMLNSRGEENLKEAVEKIKSSSKVEVHYLAGDITNPEISKALIAKTIEHFGKLDILIPNSGGPRSGAFESFTDEEWYNAFDLNFMSHVRMIREAVPWLNRSDCASVLTVTSYVVKQPLPNLILSNSIRAATVALTKSLALELGNSGIRFNSILPGWTQTERVTELMRFRAEQNNTSIEEEIIKQTKESPLGRMANPREFAQAAAFLASPAAAYITGNMFSIDGGMYKGIY